MSANLSRRVAQLEFAQGVKQKEDACPLCAGTDIADPTDEQAASVDTWPYEEVNRTWDDLAHRAARLAWCPACEKLVPVGQQDPDWRRQFWDDCVGEALARNMAHLQFLRAVMIERTSWRTRVGTAPGEQEKVQHEP